MERFYIEKTKGSPEINFDPDINVLVIRGQSYPENAFKFYEPVFKWVDYFLAGDRTSVHIEINLSYINTSSSKCIMMLLERFEKAYRDGMELTLNWYYDVENESELECAEDFKEDITLPMKIIPLQEEV